MTGTGPVHFTKGLPATRGASVSTMAASAATVRAAAFLYVPSAASDVDILTINHLTIGG